MLHKLLAVMLLFSFAVPSQQKPRIYVTTSESWSMSGGWAVKDGDGGGRFSGGARPQTAETIKTVNERCPGATVTMNKEKADYALLLDHEGGKGYARRDNKVAAWNRDEDVIFSGSTRSLGNAVKDGCAAIMKDWAAKQTK